MMLRTRIDPKTGAHTLREPAQSKCAWNKWTLQKSHFAREFTGKMPQTKTVDHTLCEPAQSKCTWTFHRGLRTYRKNPSVWTHCLGQKDQEGTRWSTSDNETPRSNCETSQTDCATWIAKLATRIVKLVL